MNSILKNSLIIFFSLMVTSMPVLALDLDLSVDEEIKKKYDTSKLQYDVLPALPKVDSTKTITPQNQQQVLQLQPLYQKRPRLILSKPQMSQKQI